MRFFGLILLLLGSSLFSQAQNLIGTWNLNAKATESFQSVEQKKGLTDMGQERKVQIMNTFQKRTFSFKENGIFEVIWNDGVKSHTKNGAWLRSGNDLTITVDQRQTNYTLVSVKTKELIIKNKVSEGFFSTLVFDRQ